MSHKKISTNQLSTCGFTVIKEKCFFQAARIRRSTSRYPRNSHRSNSQRSAISLNRDDFQRLYRKQDTTCKLSQRSDGHNTLLQTFFKKRAQDNLQSLLLEEIFQRELSRNVPKNLRRTTIRKNRPASASLHTVGGLVANGSHPCARVTPSLFFRNTHISDCFKKLP
jgi:hypothetical protein